MNDQTQPIAGCMPILQAITEYVRGKKHFGLFDFLEGFWQLPLAKKSQELLSYMTDRYVYTPMRVPQGCCDAPLYFQKTMETCFKKLLVKLEEFLELLDFFGLKLSVRVELTPS